METLTSQFSTAVSNVTVTDAKAKRAIAAHTEVRELLESDARLKAWGIDTFLIGSYGRSTSRFPAKDVDVFLRFTKLDVSANPEEVYGVVHDILVGEYGLKDVDPAGRCVAQARSISVDFPDPATPGGFDEFHIDAVPAVRWGEHWGIPNKNRESWTDTDTRWIKTDPVAFSDMTNDLATLSSSPTVSGDNAYRPVVRLLRQVRHVHVREERPGGLYTEVAAYYSWKTGQVSGDSYAELLAGSLKAVADQFSAAAHSGLADPVLGTTMRPALPQAQWEAAARTFQALSVKAYEALNSEACQAAYLWREILGVNERGPILPLPDGCDAYGRRISSVSAVSAVGSNQPRGFA